MVKSNYKLGDYKISDIYQGGISSLNPSFSSYSSAGSLGMTTDPRVANILQEVSSKLSSGAKNIEVEGVSSEIFDSIPKQQLKEVNRLAKLTGIDVSLHGPVIDSSGISQNGFSESERESAERRITDVLLRSKELNPDGNICVTFHSAEGIPGSQFLPESERKDDNKYKKIISVNKESGRIAPISEDVKYYIDSEDLEKGQVYSPEKRIDTLNKSEWDNEINKIFFNQERAEEILEKNYSQIEHLMKDLNEIKEKHGEVKLDLLNPSQRKAYQHYVSANNYLQEIYLELNGLFSKAYEFGDPEKKINLKNLRNRFDEFLNSDENKKDIFGQIDAMRFLSNELRKREYAPKLNVPVEEFAIEKSSQTFGNSAYNAYKKFNGKNVPFLVIENPPAGFALSTGEDIANIVQESRKQFVKQAVKDGLSESLARKEAEKHIGATWDVGHINMLRKYGYTEQEIVKETEKVAPYVKHIHLSDNFGFEHTELPMGMGNVPIKEMMEKLGQKGFESKKIIEAASWWQHMKSNPFQETLESMGSPFYSMKMDQNWKQSSYLQQGYSSGMEGQWLPQINYETFGAGFSQLPKELGGSAQGGQGGRMSGRPME